jgi:large subunit ribosomal protein L5
MSTRTKYQPRLKVKYRTEIVKNLQEKFQYKNPMQVPRLVKIVINQGIGEAVADKKLIESSIKELSMITGQKAIPTISKKDISNFKLRRGTPIGAKVTLRGDRMYEFLDRLIAAALPRIRDFKGVNPKSFDGRGNYNLGISEQIIFPEIDIDKVNKIMGMDINIVTTAKTDKEAFELLKEFGMPFRKQ